MPAKLVVFQADCLLIQSISKVIISGHSVNQQIGIVCLASNLPIGLASMASHSAIRHDGMPSMLPSGKHF
jgi:hypothetical protein